MSKPKYNNRLLYEKSPYLQQHGHNPVDWYPWGEEALAKARKEEKPIFLSIGYSACHWCHVMEKESFEDEETAKLMNSLFINIKVDREERQDLDNIYMNAVQMMTHHGGWPMSVFLTPDLKPFYGGTYFPPTERMGMPGFKMILMGVANAWKTKRDEVTQSADALVTALKEAYLPAQDRTAPVLNLIDNAVMRIKSHVDPQYGGVGSAPKFFHTGDFKLLLRHWKATQDPDALQAVVHTLDRWSRGGIYDVLAGGFHRYSTDEMWLVPHFEKMLYDNALVSEVYLEAFQATRNPEFSRIAHETLDFVLRDMTSSDGAFYSTLDADSEGVEGKFYVWSEEEIKSILFDDLLKTFTTCFGVTPNGNWEGHTIPYREKSWEELQKQLGVDQSQIDADLELAKRKLLSARNQRIKPFRDEKILTNWNGMMIHSLAYASQVLGEKRYLLAAEKAASLLFEKVWDKETKTLFHSYKDGGANHAGYLDDYATLANACLTLYESTFDREWILKARLLADRMLELFWEPTEKSFYYTAKGHQYLVVRPREIQDGATPSATGFTTTLFARLGRLMSYDPYLKTAQESLNELEKTMRQYPQVSAQMLLTLDFLLRDPIEIVLAASTDEELNQEMLAVIHSRFLPSKVLLRTKNDWKNPHFEGRASIDNKPTVYICRNFSCQTPITSFEKLESELK